MKTLSHIFSMSSDELVGLVRFQLLCLFSCHVVVSHEGWMYLGGDDDWTFSCISNVSRSSASFVMPSERQPKRRPTNKRMKIFPSRTQLYFKTSIGRRACVYVRYDLYIVLRLVGLKKEGRFSPIFSDCDVAYVVIDLELSLHVIGCVGQTIFTVEKLKYLSKGVILSIMLQNCQFSIHIADFKVDVDKFGHFLFSNVFIQYSIETRFSVLEIDVNGVYIKIYAN